MTCGFFVTGTDTGVGKTVVSCAMARVMRGLGQPVGVMKPCETGVLEAGPLDAIALRGAAGSEDPLELICPQQFGLPAAPTVAAEAENRAVSIEAIRKAWEVLASSGRRMVVEGAGGLLVPLWAGGTMADLAGELGLPVVVVARGALGTINHTHLTLEAIERRGLTLAGVVLSHAGGALSDADEANLGTLRDGLGNRLLGEIPPLASGETPESRGGWWERWLADAEPLPSS